MIPSQSRLPEHNLLNNKDEPFMQEVMDNLLALGAVKKVNACRGQFISSYFLIKKPNGKLRFVLDLKKSK